MADQKGALKLALKHLRDAITLLDDVEAPAQIAAHVDLAASQLDELVSKPTHQSVQRSLGNC